MSQLALEEDDDLLWIATPRDLDAAGAAVQWFVAATLLSGGAWLLSALL